MKRKKSRRVLRLGKPSRKRILLLSRKARVRRGLVRKIRKGLTRKVVRYGKSKKGILLRRKRRIRRRTVRRAQVLHPGVNVTPGAGSLPAAEVVALPPDLGVPPETPPADAFQQGYTEAYNVGFDAGFAKGFEDGHKLEFG
ncbi:hypothetical protein [Paenibacillus wynnii]|uniref:hypothetical protein n=1 Tax=Paenibacillus wynnii TaxID=268407 RepID=UPI00278EB660|nr:hypothetical protein [Paenibacillus wynnii]MDQ0194536.1 hypothetical protein [Paenibacillus wynnii]